MQGDLNIKFKCKNLYLEKSVSISIHVYIYIYIEREREIDRWIYFGDKSFNRSSHGKHLGILTDCKLNKRRWWDPSDQRTI